MIDVFLNNCCTCLRSISCACTKIFYFLKLWSNINPSSTISIFTRLDNPSIAWNSKLPLYSFDIIITLFFFITFIIILSINLLLLFDRIFSSFTIVFLKFSIKSNLHISYITFHTVVILLKQFEFFVRCACTSIGDWKYIIDILSHHFIIITHVQE